MVLSSLALQKDQQKGVLIKRETATYIAFYIIQDNDIASGQIINTVEASATGPNQQTRITDISDDGDDTGW